MIKAMHWSAGIEINYVLCARARERGKFRGYRVCEFDYAQQPENANTKCCVLNRRRRCESARLKIICFAAPRRITGVGANGYPVGGFAYLVLFVGCRLNLKVNIADL